jgi:hypothetical protein
MKRQKRTYRRNFDPNIQTACLSGHRARLDGKPSTSCPNLIPNFGERYGTVLMNAWMRGWHDRDRAERIQGTQLPLEGVL